MRYYILSTVLVICIALPLGAAPNAKSSTANKADAQDLRFGALFSSNGFPFDVEEFNGGVGAQAVKGLWFGRSGLFIRYEKAETEDFSTGIRLFGARYLGGTKAKLYLGLFAGYSHSSEKTSVDENNWTKLVLDEIGVGPVLGVELSLLDNLAIFLDYELAFQATFPSHVVSAGGTVSTTKEDAEYFFGTRQGNAACIGICIYF
jgi:hypothetical protein